MGVASVYVHSKADNANLSVSIDIIDNINGVNELDGVSYVSSTINKLKVIADDLDRAADEFLQGYSLEAAEAIADNANNALAQLARRVLYGPDAYEMTNTLMRNQKVDSKKLISQLKGKGGIADDIINYLLNNKNSNIGDLSSFIATTLSSGKTTINVTEAGGHIVELGKLFDVQFINTTFRKTTEAEVTDRIFKSGKDLITGQGGAYRNMIKDLVRSSKYGKVQSKGSAINAFCNKLGKKMHSLAEKEVPFEWSGNPNILNEQIDDFIEKLKKELKDTLEGNKMFDTSNVRGGIGEEVNASITKAANSVILTLQVGNLTEEKIDSKMNNVLKEYGVTERLTQMDTFHTENKMSQTDLILVNTHTKRIARAQSKNHFVSRFTNNKGNTGPIENFRWKVEDSVNLLDFIQKLSNVNTGSGISLNSFDISNVSGAIANNLWQKAIGSYWSEKGTIVGGQKSGIDFQKELEGSLEKLLAGQIVNLLGITLQKNTETIKIDSNASNIFYVLNGRLKKTSDLVRQAIQQIEENNLKSLSTDRNRLVNVTLTGMNLKGIETKTFLVDKLQGGSYVGNEFKASQSVGESMGENILNNINVRVSLGTSIDSLAKSSLVLF